MHIYRYQKLSKACTGFQLSHLQVPITGWIQNVQKVFKLLMARICAESLFIQRSVNENKNNDGACKTRARLYRNHTGEQHKVTTADYMLSPLAKYIYHLGVLRIYTLAHRFCTACLNSFVYFTGKTRIIFRLTGHAAHRMLLWTVRLRWIPDRVIQW